MEHFVSIIMPAYNAESRIEKTVHSLERQSFQDFELIIVNDGSSDKTGQLCDSLAKQYTNIKVLHEQNAGPSKAREKGIRIAEGDLIAFVDSDDFLSDNALKDLTGKMDESDADIIQFCYKMVSDSGRLISEHFTKACSVETVKTGKEVYGFFIAQKDCTDVLWDKIFKHSLFCDIDWPESYYNEECVVLAQLYGRAKKVVTIEDQFYYYVQHDKSTTHEPFTQKMLDLFPSCNCVIQYTRNNYPEFLPEALFYLVARAAVFCGRAKDSNLNNKDDIYNSILQTFKSTYAEMMKILKQQGRTLELNKMTKVFAFSPRLALWLRKVYLGLSKRKDRTIKIDENFLAMQRAANRCN